MKQYYVTGTFSEIIDANSEEDAIMQYVNGLLVGDFTVTDIDAREWSDGEDNDE